MLRPPHSLLAALLSTAVLVTGSLGWAGWRLLDQQRAIDEQRMRDQVDNAANAIAAAVRGKLAEAGERLSSWVSNPSSPVPAIDGAVVIAMHPPAVTVNPEGGLPFVPVAVQSPSTTGVFAALETMEFADDRPERTLAGYRALTDHGDPHVRAGALLRLGRVQRKLRDFAAALVTYQRLAELGTVRIADLPAELAGLDGQRSAYLALGNEQGADDVGQQIVRGIDSGRWLITRGTAELYREPFIEARPDSWPLANALGELWRETDGQVSARGQRLFRSADPASSVLVLWRSNDRHTAALAASADRFFDVAAATDAAWQLVDPEGHIIAGTATIPTRSVARIIGNTDYPLTLHAWSVSPAAATTGSRTILLVMMGAMLAFLWGATYFMARAVRREAAVARLQSDFVAAVSHEFRSPLTTVRQMAEMLDEGRVLTDERRHKYYRIVAGEAARLQRLVETLLNFGKMEAGATRYRFADLDAAALVRDVVDDITPQARESGKAIEIEGPDTHIPVRADESALALALRNLIDNAIKYSPGEPIVWVRYRTNDGHAAICVVDRGVGVPRSEQRTIFNKFVRGRAAIDANIKGTGVGLSMVRQIVTAHGGEIHLESEPGRGSTFTVLLPVAH